MKTAQKTIAISRGNPGFTLIEVLVAIAILSIGFLQLASLLLTAVNMNSFSKSSNEAMTHARQKLEYLRSLPRDNIQLAIGGSLESDVTGYNDTVGDYHRRWRISLGPGTAHVCEVRVVPADPDPQVDKTVNLATMF